MVKGFALVSLSVVFVVFAAGLAMAQHSHGHGDSSVPSPSTTHSMPMENKPGQSLTVEGYKISLEVMDMSKHMAMPGMKGSSQHSGGEHSRSHALMVTVQDMASKEIISDAKVTYMILNPSGTKETGQMEWSGDHFGGGFSPKEKGTYQVQLKIESGGMDREAKFSYEAK